MKDPMNKRILIVDDNPAIHDDFRKILVADEPVNSSFAQEKTALFDDAPAGRLVEPFDIQSAFQGQEALQWVERSVAECRPFAMAFMDVRMPPGWDGIETISHLWKADPEIEIVLCTAYADYSWEDIVRKLGQSDRLV